MVLLDLSALEDHPVKSVSYPGLLLPPVDFERMLQWTYYALQMTQRFAWFKATTPRRFIYHARPGVN